MDEQAVRVEPYRSEVERTRTRAVSLRGLAAALNQPWIAVLIFSVAIVKTAMVGLHLENHFTPEDFSVYYCSGLLLRHGHDPYHSDLITVARGVGLETGHISQATDPPSFLLAFEPLTLLSVHHAYWAWQGISLAAFAIALIILLWPGYSGLSGFSALALAGFAIMYPPVGNNFAIAQSKALVLLPLAVMVHCMERKRDGMAGLMLAVAGLLRMFPLLLAVYLVFKRRWRMLGYTIAGVAIGGLATIAIMGFHTSFGFLSAVNFLTRQRWLENTANIAISAFISRIFWGVFGNTIGFRIDLARYAAIIAADLGVLYLVMRATPMDESADSEWRTLSLWLVASVMLSPTAWFHYMILMMIPFAMMARAANRGTVSTRALWMVIVSYVLTGLTGDLLVAVHSHPILRHQFRELEFACLLTMFVASLWFAADGSPQRPALRTAMRGVSQA